MVVASALLTACWGGDDDDQEITDVNPFPRDTAKIVGTCLDFPKNQTEIVTDLPTVPSCAVKHTHEIYFVDDYENTEVEDDSVYPGFDALEDFARIKCLTEFEVYVGRGPFDSEFFYTWLVPTLESWNDRKIKDRQVICMLGGGDAEDLIGSKKKDPDT